MTIVAPSITHESETQRQFVRLKMPCMVEIDAQRFSVKDLSSGGVAIRDIEAGFKKGDRLSLKLIMPFEKFSLDVVLHAQVQHVDKKLHMIGCRFIDLDATQISILNHIVRAYISGDIVGGNDILNVVARNNFVKVRQHAGNEDRAPLDKIKNYAIYGGLSVLAVLFSYFIISTIVDRLYTLETPYGVIDVTHYDVAAPASGIFKSALPAEVSSVAKGALVGIIAPALSDQTVNVYSPCDCFVTARTVLAGQYAAEGTPLLTLTPQKSDVTVLALIPAQQALGVRMDTTATLKISGNGKTVRGHVSDIQASDKTILDSTSTPTATQSIRIIPDEPLPPDMAGRPVFVEIDL